MARFLFLLGLMVSAMGFGYGISFLLPPAAMGFGLGVALFAATTYAFQSHNRLNIIEDIIEKLK